VGLLLVAYCRTTRSPRQRVFLTNPTPNLHFLTAQGHYGQAPNYTLPCAQGWWFAIAPQIPPGDWAWPSRPTVPITTLCGACCSAPGLELSAAAVACQGVSVALGSVGAAAAQQAAMLRQLPS